MPNETIVTNITQNGKYCVTFKKAESANKIDGFSVEANDDDMKKAFKDAQELYINALAEVEKNKPVVAPAIKPEVK